ncbi:MAG: sigma-70 family RNA polymerase sigma factor [Candidatus Omnitrophica bacterium]|nr:sigma-70 family RNA polymerase sigma factor [Candidatus Omnitrophota bacterium]
MNEWTAGFGTTDAERAAEGWGKAVSIAVPRRIRRSSGTLRVAGQAVGALAANDAAVDMVVAAMGAAGVVMAAGTAVAGAEAAAPALCYTLPMSSDADIIEAVLRGETDRYAELVTRYQLAAWKLAYSFIGNVEDAKDVSQNGFVKAYQHLRDFRGRAKFSTWLYRIIVNECKDFFKRQARRPAAASLVAESYDDESVVFELADPGGTPHQILVDRELAVQLNQAIQMLPHQQQTAFILHHLHGIAVEDVAQMMDCRAGTVKAHLFRACEQLRARLSPYLQSHAEVRS